MEARDMAGKHRAWVAVATTAALLAGLLFPACKGETREILLEQEVSAAEGATIATADGKVTLEIPAGALEKDTEITVGVVPEEDWTEDIRSLDPAGLVYALEPDGLEFSKPVTIVLRFDLNELAGLGTTDSCPALLLLSRDSDDQWDILRKLTTKIHLDTGEVTVSGETSHFCVLTDTLYSLTISYSPRRKDAQVGEEWDATVEVANAGSQPLAVTLEYEAQGAAVVMGPSAVPLTVDGGSSAPADPQPCYKCLKEGGTSIYVTMALPYKPDIVDTLVGQFGDPEKTEEALKFKQWQQSVTPGNFLMAEVSAIATCAKASPSVTAADPGTSATTPETPDDTTTTEDPDATTTEPDTSPDDTDTAPEDADATASDDSSYEIESDSAFETDGSGLYTVMFDLPDDMKGTVYDFEIYPSDQLPKWTSVSFPDLPAGMSSSPIEGGWTVTSQAPFPVTPFTVKIEGDPGSTEVGILLSDENHDIIGWMTIPEGDITADDAEPTTAEPEATIIESSSVFQEQRGKDEGIYTVMFVLPDDMEGQVYDFEIYPAEMTPPWEAATIPGLLRPGVYRSNIERGGVRVFSNQPFAITPFIVEIEGDSGAEELVIYLTDKDHETIGVLHIPEGEIPADVLTPPQTDDSPEPSNPCPSCGNDPCTC